MFVIVWGNTIGDGGCVDYSVGLIIGLGVCWAMVDFKVVFLAGNN